MDEPLHPSGLSEILDRTAQIYRSRFLVFLGIAVIPTAALLAFAGVAVLTALRWGSSGASPPSFASIGIIALAFVVGLIFIVLPVLVAVSAFATAAMSHAASRAFLGQTTTIRDSYKAVWRRGWRYIGLFIFEFVVIWVLPVGAWSVLVVLSAALAAIAQSVGLGGGALFVLAGFLIVAGLITYGFWMALRLSLAFPACVVEQAGVWNALKRSATLTNGTKGRILLLYLLGLALNWILSIAITVPLSIAMFLLPASTNPQHAQTAATLLLLAVYAAAFAVQAVTRPVYGIALMLFYYDQRIRQEGFDIEWMMLRAGLVVPPQPLPQPQPLPRQPAQLPVAEPNEARSESDSRPAVAAADQAPDATLPPQQSGKDNSAN
jgi:membrane-anchored glycerophosphoryl diester phosphodiesterase (GDPDase)